MHQDIENIIKKNLPEKKEAGLYTTSKATGGDIINYNREDNDDKREGFNQAISQINTSLLADEVLKVVVGKLDKATYEYFEPDLVNFTMGKGKEMQYKKMRKTMFDLLSNLSPNKENKNNG